ncbi:MAG: hypothetical protein GY805_24430 [Chloroflexi bacterium]|nr:hypothetical protein [Chloroflexota bacterium]
MNNRRKSAQFVLLTQAVFILWIYRRNWPRLRVWIAAWVTMAALFLPWILIHLSFLGGKASSRFDEWTLDKFVEIMRRTLVAYGAGVTLAPGEN